MDMLEQLCRNPGLKLTIRRRIVLEVLDAATIHPCAHEIHRRTEKERRIGVDTVYSALNSLTAAGLVTRHAFSDVKARYERVGRAAHPSRSTTMAWRNWWRPKRGTWDPGWSTTG